MKNYARAIFLLVVGISVSLSIVAQTGTSAISTSDKYVISAKAGGVNFVEGPVSVTHPDGRSGIVMKGDIIEIGDRVSTASNGRVEILLNPGSYLRLGGDSSLEFKTTSLDNLQIKFFEGSAIFEVFATDKFRVNVATPKEKIAMFETGVYRIDLQKDGSGTIAVTEGKAVVGPVARLTLVTSGTMATFGAGTPTLSKISKNKKDALADWSKSRAKDLAKLTASLQKRNSNSALYVSLNGGGWSYYDSFGLWVRDPRSGAFCFMPFGRGWYSPYGYGYGNGVGPVYTPPIVPIRPPVDPTDLSRRKEVSQDDRPLGPPPFTAIERQQREADFRRNVGGERGPLSGDNGRFSSPANDRSYSSDTPRSGGFPVGSSSTPSAPSAPITPRTDSPARESSPIDH